MLLIHKNDLPRELLSEDDLLLYDVENEVVHILNKSAKQFYDLCDGRTLEEARTLFTNVNLDSGVSEQHLLTESDRIIGLLQEKGIVSIEDVDDKK